MFILTKATSQVFSKITNTNNLSRNLFQILFSPRQSLIIIFGTIISIERESRGKKFYFYSRGLARPPRFDGTREYRPYSIISFHRDRSRSAERLGCVPLRWKFWPSERKTVDRGDTSPWKRVGCSYPISKRWEADRLSNVKRVYVFLSKISFSNGVERDWYLLFKNFSWEKFYNKVR